MVKLFAFLIISPLLACLFFLVRNKWVYDFRVQEIERSEYKGGKLYPYHLLPSYERMVYSFWVFDFYKFYPKEVERG